MYATTDISPFVQRSQDTADFFVSVRKAYGAIRRNLGHFSSVVLSILVLPLATGLVWIFLRSQRQKLRNLLSTQVDLSDYKKIRLEYDRLNAIFEVVRDANFENLATQAPWMSRGIAGLMADILHLIRQRRDAIGRALEQLDFTAPHTELLKPIPEETLWKHRTKAYDYRF